MAAMLVKRCRIVGRSIELNVINCRYSPTVALIGVEMQKKIV
jgi:hypothetical protein